jgi:hypothetical protein
MTCVSSRRDRRRLFAARGVTSIGFDQFAASVRRVHGGFVASII